MRCVICDLLLAPPSLITSDCIVTNELISQLSPEVTSFVIVADLLLGVVAVMDSGSASKRPD